MTWLTAHPVLWVLLIIVLLVLVGIVLIFKHTRQKEKISTREEIMQYQENLTEIYDMMRIFRHNFNNTITTMKGCYEEGDFEKIGEILNDISNDFDDIQNKQQFSIASQIEDPSLKWLLISKMSIAQRYGINLSLMISKEVGYGKLKSYEFNTIVGTLLDNAIDAAKESKRKQIKITLFNKNGDTILSVKNTFEKKPVIASLFKKGYSEKKGHTGLGLYKVKKIVDAHKEILMDMRVTDEYFVADFNISNSN